MNMQDVDFKGYDPYTIQNIINSYYWQSKSRQEERKRIEQSRKAQGNRAKVRNALKRAGLSVRTQEGSWRASGWELGRWTSDIHGNRYQITRYGADLNIVEQELRKIRAKGELDVKTIVKITDKGINMTHYVKLAEVN